MGPSFAKEPRAFRERYGSDRDMLLNQNRLLIGLQLEGGAPPL
tara:strand:- start:1246 stop:1374 length:129 start_codon:yes stop_codon:yes gene_type:complete